MEKKNWIVPELIIIMRNNPEEAVLTGCKDTTVAGPGPNAYNFSCTINDPCENCMTDTPS